MSNRTDFHELVRELANQYDIPGGALERLETELHNAYVAGQEGHGCKCHWCSLPERHEGHRLIVESNDKILDRRGCLDCDVWIDPVRLR